jgi:hypothetical protein
MKVLGRTFKTHEGSLQQCLTKPGFFVQSFKTLTNSFKSFKLTRQAVDIVL